MRGAVPWIGLQIFREGIACRREFLFVQQGSPKADERSGRVASRVESRAKLFLRVGGILRSQQYSGQREVRLVILRRYSQRGAVLLDGLRKFAGTLETIT